MNKEDLLSLARNLLTIVGGFLIGHNLFGLRVDESLIFGLVGIVMSLVGIIMSIVDKSVTVEKTQGFVRHIVSTIGGILIGAGQLTAERLDMWTGIITALVPIIQGILSRQKAKLLHLGEIQTRQLKGAMPKKAA